MSQHLIQSLPVSKFKFDKNTFELPPDCFVFGLYTLAKMAHGVPPIALLFAEHSFSYWDDHHTSEQIIDPMTEFTRFGFFRHHQDPYLMVTPDGVYGEMADLLSERCGISIDVLPFTDFDRLLRHIRDQFDQGSPVLVDFNMGYIPSRHQYKIILEYEHTIFLTQFDHATQAFLISDQDVVDDPVPLDDFKACFHALIKMKGTFNCYQVTIDREKNAGLTLAQIKLDVQKNVDNLTTDHPALGIQAVRCYLQAMERMNCDNKTFYTFGTWVFPTQRRLQMRWCKIAGKTLTEPEQQNALGQLESHLTATLRKWSEYAMLEKLIRKTDRISPEKLVKKGIEAATLELESAKLWVNLQYTL
ncbi:BtrH N-terminal domain-containing protein [Veronia pacifica]|uniref:Butirosin biosynthesis protein H N-terminal domain-containing protein n=1 Tax=Veronia pacifica TaxID=1080227 RepID=A0A1C3EIL3_9GAMM|nr:BtrH N-terminal domain-containing protein [Veronia pacifica]ODA33070.1 hypothetical protein A8L45_11535 [Veronia pacifica]